MENKPKLQFEVGETKTITVNSKIFSGEGQYGVWYSMNVLCNGIEYIWFMPRGFENEVSQGKTLTVKCEAYKKQDGKLAQKYEVVGKQSSIDTFKSGLAEDKNKERMQDKDLIITRTAIIKSYIENSGINNFDKDFGYVERIIEYCLSGNYKQNFGNEDLTNEDFNNIK